MATTNKVSPEQVLDALAAHPGATSAALAEVLGIGQSTAAKHLAALEAAGTALREAGGRDGGHRLADRWITAVSAPEADTADDPESDQVDAVAAVSAGRLGRGALGTLVRNYLAARPGEAFGPTAVGQALGRSQGAVSNSLATMAARGEVELVGDKPRRYRIAS